MKTDIKLEINNKTEFHALQDLIIVTVIFFFLGLTVLFYAELPFLSLILLAFYLILYLAPVIILHSNYEKYNKNKNLTLQSDKLQFGNDVINYENIEKITVFGTYQSINKTSLSNLPYQCSYFYIEIEHKNMSKIYLTNLYSKDLIEIISNKIPSQIIKQKLTSFPLIKNSC
ncbi:MULTISPECIES: hypothetical protein [unclassified Kaistella]|uniref:hypothetical protein n=1 Tax=unclassified Kaistella TaxID=2762626 RepID=UPI002734F9BF|nr:MULTISPECIES: hypothetical protein [unclassified Kaistella]MDP2453935.1 hypothetical protein [Kaistella sp. SH11-4b]MDP2456992.1 hypothetical protein [Kaistella sp. SH40-3]MDP2459749.1 hypothetical protein [Kaistella sp. SH19-2b]